MLKKQNIFENNPVNLFYFLIFSFNHIFQSNHAFNYIYSLEWFVRVRMRVRVCLCVSSYLWDDAIPLSSHSAAW